VMRGSFSSAVLLALYTSSSSWTKPFVVVVHGFVPDLATSSRHISVSTAVSSQVQYSEDVPFPETNVEGAAERKEGGGKVSVRVERTFPVPPVIARKAWMEYHWKKGGGLPIFVIKNEENSYKKRIVAPIMMEETIVASEEARGDSATLRYTVTKPGPFLNAKLVPETHMGTVSFISSASSSDSGKEDCQMIWDVEFETTRFRSFYQAFTEFSVGIASRTVAEALATPRLLKMKVTLPSSEISQDIAAVEARKQWLEFCWKNGGGLPLPPAISFGELLEDGGGTARKRLLRIPPLLIESVTNSSSSSQGAEVFYQISNPGWMAFPFLVHSHLGRVKFMPSLKQKGAVDIVWEVEIRPYSLMGPAVEKLTEMVVSTMLQNHAIHWSEPGARVAVKAPRGKKIAGNLERFWSVPKESWLGGVLDAHLLDKRSTWQQTLAMFQPWTWGRSGDEMVLFEWENGEIDIK